MKHQQRLPGLTATFGILILIFDSATALEGARSGVELCLKTVVPSLFPFFVLSILLTDAFTGVSLPFLYPVTRFLRIPKASASILIPAFLGGYPVGAQCIGNLYQKKRIGQDQAQRLLAFCNNAGPSFLFGMVSGFFPEKWMVWALWLIHIVSAMLTALTIPAAEDGRIELSQSHISFSDSMFSAVKVMGSVCGWVVLFRTIIGFLKKWFLWMLPMPLQVFLIGILELVNGCCELNAVATLSTRFIICSCILAFGGVCVFLQTLSVTKGLSLRFYIRGKVIQSVFSFLLSSALILENGVVYLAGILFLLIMLRKLQKRYSIPKVIPV